MKSQKLFRAILCIATSSLIFFTGCSKEEATPPPQTSLQVTLTDNLGNRVSGATVKLYSTQTDWQNGTNQIGTTQVSDANGVVTFSNVSAIQYFWFAQKDCQNNANGSVKTASNINVNVTNTVSTVLASTGTLKFVNTSSNPYQVYINGTLSGTVNGGVTSFINYAPTGSYSIRVLQVSGYAVYPTDKTYTGTVDCGTTLTTTFP